MRNWQSILRNLRHSRGLKQAVIADWLNVTQATVSRWETGKQVPDLSAQRRLRDLLNQFRTRIDADVAALMSSTIADRSLLDADCYIRAVSEFGLKSISANASDLIGKCAHSMREDALYEQFYNEHDHVLRRGDFISAEGCFFSKRANSWIATYTVPVLVGGHIHLFSDRRRVARERSLRPSLTIRFME